MEPFGRMYPPSPRAVWTLLARAKEEDPLIYVGRVLKDANTEVWRCEHKHATRDEAQACAAEHLTRSTTQ